jgi:enamine deaminase RidA (YjgF/YER057c/UK114 family)
VYVGAVAAQDDHGAVVGNDDIGAQTRRVLERCGQVLRSAGSSLDRVLSVMVYLKSASDFEAMNDVYRTFWPTDPPTRTTVVTALPEPRALVEMSMVAAPAGAERTVIHPNEWLRSPSPYSYAIRSVDTVFLSGLVSRRGRDNSAVTGTAGAQTKVILDSAGELLAAAGLTHANVVSARVYLTDVASFQQMNDAYRPYFPTAPPTRATVQTGLAGSQYSVEITLVASSAPREVIDAGAAANPNLSAAIRANGRVYLSGALGNTPANAADAAAQTRETLAKLRRTLDAAGCSADQVTEVVVYVTDLESCPAVERELRTFFGNARPATTIVGTGLVVPDGLVEAVMTAFRQ